MRMDITVEAEDVALLAAIEDGLPLCERPFAAIGEKLGTSEDDVIYRLERMRHLGIIRRFGLVLQHRQLGFCANAMVVWDIPDNQVDEAARGVVAHDFVTLCYCRARKPGVWPYNLYCMIHGRQRQLVEQHIIQLKHNAGLEGFPSQTLFSCRRFKQTGARFSAPQPAAGVVE